jgi:beta-barrel assembly-enhancing protease
VLGRYYDGLTAKPLEVDIAVTDGAISFAVDDASVRWPLSQIRSERIGDLVRLAPAEGDARLLVEAGAWRDQAGDAGLEAERRTKLGELRLVVALAVGGLVVTAFVFIGMPLASGPLARNTPPAFERQIGDNFDAQLSLVMKDCQGEEGQDVLYLFGDLLEGSDAEPFNIRVRAVEAPFVNAFALPGGAVLVTDDLIALAETPDELAAVIAHEVAHVDERHVMQAVWRSLGLGIVLDAVVGGGTGAGQQFILLAGSFTDLRFSREAEREADRRGMALLHAHGLSSQGMAPFFERIAAKDEGEDAALVKELMSSHPESLRRAKAVRGQGRPGDPAFDAKDWAAIKAACEPAKSAKKK